MGNHERLPGNGAIATNLEQMIMFLVADLVGDGVVGDNEREGMEEDMQSYEQIITIDLISHGVKNKGKMADQKTVIKFREHAKDKLSYWLANRLDQLAFLTMSGISYAYNTNGSTRASNAFANLAFASNVSAPPRVCQSSSGTRTMPRRPGWSRSTCSATAAWG